MMSCRRRSAVIWPIEYWKTAKWPLSTVRRYRKITLTMIQPMGKKPLTKPNPVTLTAMLAGMP